MDFLWLGLGLGFGLGLLHVIMHNLLLYYCNYMFHVYNYTVRLSITDTCIDHVLLTSVFLMFVCNQ